jgi:hypothetical protein
VADHETSSHRREVLGHGAVDALVLEREAGAAVLGGVRQPCESGRGELSLEGAGSDDVARRFGPGVLGKERAATLGEGVRLVGGEGGARHRCSVFIHLGSLGRLVLYGYGMYAAIQLWCRQRREAPESVARVTSSTHRRGCASRPR